MDTHIRYVARSSIFETEKAFTTDFPVDHVEGARRTNQEEDHQPVTINCIENPNEWKLDEHGFCFIKAETHVEAPYTLDTRNEIQKSYWQQIEAIVHEKFPQYSRIESFDFTVRKRDADFPEKARGYRQEYVPPATTAHCDYSRNGSYLVLQHSFPGQEMAWKDKTFDFINVWRPLNVTDDWPLAVCDYNTIDKENDILLTDSIRRSMVSEVSLLHYNKNHKWYYLKDHGVDDLLVFRNTDSEGKLPRAFHAAIPNPNSTGPFRESVEVRLVAFY
ncbi:CmcJ-like methyltransferase [Penicillium sp. IBT 31633x]|nr:CmcJ-like methyltransferase [Penicillium sp. IBT 31633x]